MLSPKLEDLSPKEKMCARLEVWLRQWGVGDKAGINKYAGSGRDDGWGGEEVEEGGW